MTKKFSEPEIRSKLIALYGGLTGIQKMKRLGLALFNLIETLAVLQIIMIN